jgi:hypothetical protein
VQANQGAIFMNPSFEIVKTRKIQGSQHEATVRLKSAVCPDSEFVVSVFINDIKELYGAVRAKLLEFAQELQSAAKSGGTQ